jgi:hypothetical protein
VEVESDESPASVRALGALRAVTMRAAFSAVNMTTMKCMLRGVEGTCLSFAVGVGEARFQMRKVLFINKILIRSRHISEYRERYAMKHLLNLSNLSE